MPDDLTVLRIDVDSEAMRLLLESLPGIAPAERPVEDREPTGETASAPATDRSGPRVGETPPPGAGESVDRTETETEGGDRRRTLLAAGAGVTVLAALAGVAIYLYRQRSTGEDAGFETEPSHAEREPTPDREASSIDSAPLVGMALLAVGGAIVRRVRSDGGSTA